MFDKGNKILILIPSYNAAEHLAELVDRIKKATTGADIVVINDGSTDCTETVLKNLVVSYLTYPINRGKGYALQQGIAYAIQNGYEYVMTIDADLQHLPEEIPNFIKGRREADIYMGTRDLRSALMPVERRLTNYLTSLIVSIFSGRRIRDSQSGYRMISTDILRRLRVSSVRYDFESELLFQAGVLKAKIVEVPISTIYENARSYINPLVDTGRFIRLIWRRILL